MPHSHRLSLAAAVLINLNIMVGSGIFINTVVLAQLAGAYSTLTYLLVSFLILPLMLSFAQLAHIHQGGSLYRYGAAIHPYAGFFSSWGYFFTKLASCAVAIHVSATLLASIIPPLAQVSLLWIDLFLLALFTTLNCYQVHIGKRMQRIFMAGKLIPIITIILAGIIFFKGTTVSSTPLHAIGIITGIPLVLYAFLGFEASAGFMHRLAHPERDGWRAMIIAFILGVIVTTLFQLFLFGILPQINLLTGYRDLFPALLAQWQIAPTISRLALCLLHGGIAASAAGVGFSILYANAGNLYELAAQKLLPSEWNLTKENSHQMPMRCIIIEAIVVLAYLVIGHQSLPTLQQLAAFGATCTFGISVYALYLIKEKLPRYFRFVLPAAALSCGILSAACVRNFLLAGILPLLFFAGIQAIGFAIYAKSSRA